MFWRTVSIPFVLFLATACGDRGDSGRTESEVSGFTAQDSSGSSQLEQASIGAFNLLRLTPTNKDYRRMVELIDQSDLHIFAGIEIMSSDAAQTLLEALNRYSNKEWGMSLSKTNNGESSYKEWFAYYYQTRYVKQLDQSDQYCRSSDAVDRQRNVCFARDHRESGPDFNRDPFVGHFMIGSKKFTLVAVHLYYGGRDARSIALRQHELTQLRKATERVKRATPQSNVLLVGDFNLVLTESSYGGEIVSEPAASSPSSLDIPSQFLTKSPSMAGLISEATTIGRSNYDHIFFFEDNQAYLMDESFGSLIDFNPWSRTEKDQYKSDVSDHYPIKASFGL